MNNIIKNLLLVLTLICVIALVVFCIQLIILNRGTEQPEPGASLSAGSQQDGEGSEGSGEDISGGEGSDESTNGDGFDNFGIITPRPPPQGLRHDIMVAENSWLIIYARDDLFEFVVGDLDWWFVYIGEGIATLEINYTLVSPQGVGFHAESFLNDFTGSNNSEYTGEQLIQGSALSGYHVSTRHGGSTYEAWIHILDDSDLALVFTINYQNNEQRDAIYEILSSLDMEGTLE